MTAVQKVKPMAARTAAWWVPKKAYCWAAEKEQRWVDNWVKQSGRRRAVY